MTQLVPILLALAVAQQPVEWTVGEPKLEIGSVLGGGPTEFGAVAGVVQLAGGSVVVADRLSDEVRFFDADGRIEAVRGRSGSGPGEFRLITWIGLCGADSIFVLDGSNKRLTTFNVSGELIGTQPASSPKPGSSPWRLRCTDRHFLVVSQPDHPARPQPGPFQLPVSIGWFDISGEPVKPLGQFPGPELYVLPSLRGARPRPLGAEVFIEVLGSMAVIGTSDREVIQLFDIGGRNVTEIPVPLEARPTTDIDISAFIESETSEIRDAARAAQHARDLRNYEWPTVLPRYDAMVADPAGYIWLRPYSVPGSERTVQWKVIDLEGRVVAKVTLPSSIEVAQVAEEWLIGIRRSALGVESVLRLPLERH